MNSLFGSEFTPSERKIILKKSSKCPAVFVEPAALFVPCVCCCHSNHLWKKVLLGVEVEEEEEKTSFAS